MKMYDFYDRKGTAQIKQNPGYERILSARGAIFPQNELNKANCTRLCKTKEEIRAQ